MIKKTLLRSGLQLLGLCVLALFLSTTPVDASMNSCEEQAAECASHCGTSVGWEQVGQYWDIYRMEWHYCSEYGWHYHNIPGYSPIMGPVFGSGVEYWECIPNDGGNGLCMCRY